MGDAAASAGRQTSAGVNWKPERGKLYRFHGDGHTGLGGVSVIRPWPAPAAWAKGDRAPAFHHSVPRIDLRAVHPDPDRRRDARWPHRFERDAWERVPPRVREAVCRAHLDGQQWRALSFQARVPGARQLATDVPLLAALLACANAVRPAPVARPLRSARALLRHPAGWTTWRRAARWLGLDDSKAMVRVLRKAGRADDELGAWSVHAARRLRLMWADPRTRKLMLHLDRTTPAVAELMAWSAEAQATSLLTPSLLEEVRAQEGRLHLSELVRLLADDARDLGAPGLLRPVHSVAELEARVADSQRRVDAAFGRGLPDRPLPPPPLPPPPGGRALDTVAALVEEGRALRHCIGGGTYAALARGHHGYGYALQGATGARATVWIGRPTLGALGFGIQQVQGPGNTEPHPALVALTEDWLRHHESWARHRAGLGPRPPGEAPPPPAPLWGGLPPVHGGEPRPLPF